jgi:hypothetical protein
VAVTRNLQASIQQGEDGKNLPPSQIGVAAMRQFLEEFCVAKLHAGMTFTSGFAEGAFAQGIGGARSGRASGGTPAKPGFLRSKKCAQKSFMPP